MRTLSVHFSDACTDVLVFLADQPRGNAYTIAGIADRIAPPDADNAPQTASSALRTLYDCGLVEPVSVDGIGMWRATDAGRAAVAEARAKPSTVPDHLPDNDVSRGHGSVR